MMVEGTHYNPDCGCKNCKMINTKAMDHNNPEDNQWEAEFERTEYNKLAFIGSGAEEWKKKHNQKIRDLLSQQAEKQREEERESFMQFLKRHNL